MKRVFLLLLLVLMTSMTSASIVDFTEQLADQQNEFDFTNKLADKTTTEFSMELSQKLKDPEISEVLANRLADKEHINMLVDFRNCADQEGTAELTLSADNKTEVVLRHGKTRAVLHNVAGDTLNAFVDDYEGEDKLTTPVFAASTKVELAEISLPKNGPVTAIMKCSEFDVENFTCLGEWVNSRLPFVDNGTHVSFNATSFSGFGGGNISIINVQSYPVRLGTWKVEFTTEGTDTLLIRAINETTWDISQGEDLQFLEITCNGTPVNYTWLANRTVYVPAYSCNATGAERSVVQTYGKHTLEFVFGDDVAYAHNQAGSILVQANLTSIPVSGTTSNVTLNTAVDLNKTFLLVDSTSSIVTASTGWDITKGTGKFLNSTVIQFTRFNPSATISANISFFAIEASNIFVRNGTVNFGTTGTSITTPIEDLGTDFQSKCFTTVDSRSNGGSGAIVDGQFAANLTNRTTITLTRANTGTAALAEFFVVCFQDDTTVQTGTAQMSSGGTFATVKLDDEVDPTNAWLTFSHNADTPGVRSSSVRGRLFNSTHVEFEKEPLSDGANTIQWYVIEFDTANVSGNVQRNITMTESNSVDQTIQSVNLSSTFLESSSHVVGGGNVYPRWPFIELFINDSLVRQHRGRTAGPAHIAIQAVTWNIPPANFHPTTPTSINCDGSSNCNIAVDTDVTLNASSSTDPENDAIIFELQASLDNLTVAENNTDVQLRGQLTLQAQMMLEEFEGPDWAADAAAAGSTGCSGGFGRNFNNCDDNVNDYDFAKTIGGTPISNVFLLHMDDWDSFNATRGLFFNFNPQTACEGYQCMDVIVSGQVAASALDAGEFCRAWARNDTTGNFTTIFDCNNGETCEFTGTANTLPNGAADFVPFSANLTTNFSINLNTTDNASVHIGALINGGGDDCYWDDINLTGVVDSRRDFNTSRQEYQNIDSEFDSIDNITIVVEVTSYNPEASVSQSTADPDLELQLFDGTDFVVIGEFDLNETYVIDGLNTTTVNFSITTTNAAVLSAWKQSKNQDVVIRGILVDAAGSTADEINFTNVFFRIAGKRWIVIGNHSETNTFSWNTTDLAEQSNVDLRARATDPNGSGRFSLFFEKDAAITITHQASPIVQNVILNATSQNNLTSDNLTLFFDTSDPGGDTLKNITNYLVQNSSLTLANLPFEGGSNSTFTRDYTRLSNNGTVSGATFNSTGGFDSFGAYEFNETTDFIEINTTAFRTGNMTFMAWVNADTFLPLEQYVFGHTTLPAFANRIQLYTITGGVLSVGLGDTHALGSGTNLSTGEWHHVALSFEDTNFTVYLDGVLDFNGTFTGLSSFAGFMDIGNDGDPVSRNEAWNGTIDEVMIFNRSLSSEQILAIFNNQTDIIVSQETVDNEIWQACVVANDGTLDSEEICSNNLTILVPEVNVVNVFPAADQEFLLNETVNITVNVTSVLQLDVVAANVTFPNGTTIQQTMASAGQDIFNLSFGDMTLRGQYNITYIVNDTAGTINATVTTFFNRVALDVIDLQFKQGNPGSPNDLDLTFANYSTEIVSNVSGLLNLTVSVNDSRFVQFNISNYDETSPFSILIYDESSQSLEVSSAVYGIDSTGINHSNLTVSVNATSTRFLECSAYTITTNDCTGVFTPSQNTTPGQTYSFSMVSAALGFAEATPVSDVALAPFSNTSFVIAYIANNTNDVVFKVMNTTGVEIVGETVVDSTVDEFSRVSVWPINSTHFAMAWVDTPVEDVTRAIININGSIEFGPTDVDTNVDIFTDVSVTQLGDRFPVCYANDQDEDADFQIFNNTDNTQLIGQISVDGNIRTEAAMQNLIECAAFNSTRWVYAWYDDQSNDASFQRVDQSGVDVGGVVDFDSNVGEDSQIAVTTLNSDRFVGLFYDAVDQDITIEIRTGDNVVILGDSDIDTNAGNETRVSLATVREDENATRDMFVAVWWNQSDDRLVAGVFDENGTVFTSPFTITTQINSSFRLHDTTARDIVSGNELCPGKFVVAYSTSTDQAVFSRFNVDGSSWDGICGEAAQVDIVVTDTQIQFNDSHPRENQNITINATINNTGTTTASSVVVQFFDNTSGVQIGSDFTITSIGIGSSVVVNQTYISIIGNRTILVAADPANTIIETDETNNNATAQLNVQAHTIFFGKILGNLTLSTDTDTFYTWNATDAGILYFYDNDSNFSFANLQALGFNTTNGTSFGDFAELDALLNMTNFNDSVTDLWASDNSTAVDVRNFTVFGRRIDKVPVLSSTATGTFVTGILWDIDDDTNEEFDFAEHEDIVFITNINLSQSGASGSDIDYEIRIPSLMRGYQPTVDVIAFQSEIR